VPELFDEVGWPRQLRSDHHHLSRHDSMTERDDGEDHAESRWTKRGVS
jgi:hypothetical protein